MRLIALAAIAAAAVSAPAFAVNPATPKVDHHGHEAMAHADIVDTAIGAGQFTTLVAAVQAAGLVDTLKGDGPFTVFAPLDSAFAALPEGEVARLLLPENQAELAGLLTYHVIPGAVTSDQIAGQVLTVDTVEGSPLVIDATDGVRVGNATVVQADIQTSNGVIHVVDQVIIPAS